MNITNFRIKKKTVSLALQDAHIKKKFPQFTRRKTGKEYIWTGTLQPQIVSPQYLIEIHYQIGGIPKVWVVSPILVENPPHVYASENDRLCLFWPKRWVWHKKAIIAETIIPWTALWLYYYELWQVEGIWYGPSSHEVV